MARDKRAQLQRQRSRLDACWCISIKRNSRTHRSSLTNTGRNKIRVSYRGGLIILSLYPK